MVVNRLGELLVRNKLIDEKQLAKALEEQKTGGGRLGASLVKLGYLKEEDLAAFLSRQYGVPSINLSEFEIDESVVKLVPAEVVQKYQLIPVNRAGSTLIVAMADPSNIFAIDDIKFMTGYNVEVVVASETGVKTAIDKYYDQSASFDDVMGDLDDIDLEVVDDDDQIDTSELEKASEDAPVVKLVNLILTDAIKKQASDIHVEPYEKSFRVRYRIDGVLHEVMKPPLKLKNALTSRIKIMSEMDISERRLPQDGRIKIKLPGGRDMDYRVNCLPTLFGEKICLRLLDKSNLQLDMTKLGYEEQSLEWFKEEIHKPFGMVLVTGPTGSGKTVSLYSALGELNTPTENISTAEAKFLWDTGETTFVDARAYDIYKEGHIADAIAIPYEVVRDGEALPHITEQIIFPGETRIVVYCKGGDCDESVLVAQELRDMGFTCHVYLDGYPAWVNAGYETATEGDPWLISFDAEPTHDH